MMAKNLEREGTAGVRGWWGRRSRVGRWTLWLLGAFTVAVVGKAFGAADGLGTAVIALSSMALVPLLMVLGYRWFFQRLLWKVRNRLILTYLLMGLAPVVLVGTLAGIAGYLLAGQYATDAALTLLDQAALRVRDQAYAVAVFGAAQSPARRPARAAEPDAEGRAAGTGVGEGSHISAVELRGNAWVPVMTPEGDDGTVLGGKMPEWLHPGFQGVVAAGGKLYLSAEVSVPRGGHQVVMVASSPLASGELDGMADGLGQIMLTQGFSRLTQKSKQSDRGDDIENGVLDKGTQHMFDTVTAGGLPARKHFYDVPVVFGTPITVTSWETGEAIPTMIVVKSRPTLLYTRLFSTSVEKGNVVRGVLIGVAIFFGLLELMSLLMAVSLSRTITRSVAELYLGTRQIDAGHLGHRIPVKRKDQLAALASSFNGMAASVSELLVQQREKERLQNELAIAQEVQTTLFPVSPASLHGFEVHGVCVPARTIGGDYFDFIFRTGGGGAGLTLALGDISGKGISAALLMSSLHSADRAFSVGCGVEEGVTPSPSAMLKLLNGHLFRSTQSARYATLFLASYDAATRRLTYANGGHLPPLVISKDGSVRRLDCGGSVVGLIEGLEYQEATLELEQGDLLVAFTDGLTEPEKAGEDFGEERLLQYVRTHREEPLTLLVANTLQAVKAWIGEQEQPDDMTVVMARQL